jgi:hypothetical protein
VNLRLTIEPHETLVVHLRDGERETSIAVRPASAGLASLSRAVDEAATQGYGECFWPGSPGGQYWWIFKRDAESLEVIAMWTRGGAALWEHVFRSTDSVDWVKTALDREIANLPTNT